MELLVREPFELDGVMRLPRTALTGDDAEKVAKNPELARRCTRVGSESAETVAEAPAPRPVVKPQPVEGAVKPTVASADDKE